MIEASNCVATNCVVTNAVSSFLVYPARKNMVCLDEENVRIRHPSFLDACMIGIGCDGNVYGCDCQAWT